MIPHTLGSLGQQKWKRASDKQKPLENQIRGPETLQTDLYKWVGTSREEQVFIIVHCIRGKHLEFKNGDLKMRWLKFITTSPKQARKP